MGRKGRKIVGFNVGRQNIRVFESGKEAAEWLGLLPQNINASLRNEYTGTLEGWEFFYYEDFFDTDYYKTPVQAKERGLFLLELLRDAKEQKRYYKDKEMYLQDYVYNHLKDLISLYEKEIVEYEIKIAEINYNMDLIRAKMHSMRINIDYCNDDIDIFKRFADILSDPGEANWYKEKYLNLIEICQHTEMKTESTSKEYVKMDYDKEKIHAEYFDKLNETRELESIYREFVGILEGENL